jgi:Ni,Fe-hydrogenase III large subunit
VHQVPVGPVHAGVIEPGHFRFSVNGETLVRVEERLGYTHKGIDGLLTDVDMERAARVAARISGDSTVAYSFAFARAAALQVEPPPRAVVLRGVMAELERLAHHIGDVGAICNDASFPILHAHCGILRERVLAATDRAFGHRMMMDRIVPGGVEDAGPGAARSLSAMLDEIEKPFAEVVRVYDATPRSRTAVVAPESSTTAWRSGGRRAA